MRLCIDVACSASVQAALTVAASALDAHLQRDVTISKLLVEVRPGSGLCPALGIFERVCTGGGLVV